MPEYLLQDFMNERGYVARQGRPKATEAAVALTADGRVVFGDPKTARATYAKTTSKLMYYDDEVERQRRLVCDSALGQLMLDNPKFAQPAVDLVSRGIEKYWQTLSSRLSGPEAFKKIVEVDGKYVSNPTSFGRLPVVQPSQTEVNQFKAKVDMWLSSLKGNDLPKIMTLHDTFLKIYCSNETGAGKPMEMATKFGFREDWYEGSLRGRENRPNTSYTQSAMPGLIGSDFTIPFGPSLDRSGIDFNNMRLESRNRGTDMFMIAARAMRPEFRKVLGESNLVFAASASGTTSTLLTSAKVFEPSIVNNPDSTKQYLMGCVAYLVGGGMHTCHEVFYTGGIAGLTYTTGKYIDMLPRTFTASRLYEHWAEEFWDIVRPDRSSPR
ncbi:MAG TPA: hypothetical protein VFA65_23515 [Bryobacteraceae bacterium]|nr:hypothetical protein [Bryobacteraceae bacterium]